LIEFAPPRQLSRSVAFDIMLIRSVLLLLLIPGATGAQWGPCGAKKDEVLQLGRRMEKELPLGSTEAQVSKFLEGMQLDPGKAAVNRHEPVRRYRKLRQMGAMMETPAHNEPAMYLNFYFDRRGKLVESIIRNACGTGCYWLRAGSKRGGVFRDVCW
jgi:hypothetical protein